MNSSATRTISVGATPVSIRKPPLISFITQPFTAPTNVGASNTITVPDTSAWATGLACRLSLPNNVGTMPTGLTTTALYYLIVASGTTVKFATSYANAIAGTAITVSSSSGSGIVTITPATNDPDALPVTFATIRYASGGTTVQLVDSPIAVYGDGIDVAADGDFNDTDESVQRYAVGSGVGPVLIRVTDFRS